MKELDIKRRLIQELIQRDEIHVLAHEFLFNLGRCRADVICLQGNELHGYEIKSEFDNTARLESQMDSYYKFFDYVTVVCDKKHLNDVRDVVPKKTGLLVCGESGFKTKRNPKKNLRADALVVLDAMPMTFLKKHFKANAKSKFELCQQIKETHPVSELKSRLKFFINEKFGARTSVFLAETHRVVTLDDFYSLDLSEVNLS